MKLPLRVASCLLLAAAPLLAQNEAPIKIGFLAPQSGITASSGKDMIDGFKLYFEERGNQIGGREVKLLFRDDKGSPSDALTALDQFVKEDKVDLLAGGLLANVGYALAPLLDKYRIPMLYPVMSGDDLTQRTPFHWVVRTGWNSSQPTHPFGEWVFQHLGHKKVATFAMDYPFGYEQVGGFQKSFEDAGGEVVQKIWAPLGAASYASYIAQIRKDVDAVFVVTVGVAIAKFPAEYRAAGFKLPLLGGGPTFDETFLPAMGETALGGYSAMFYSAAIDSPANRRFVKKFREKYSRVPTYYAESSYTTGMWIEKAVLDLKGNVANKDLLLDALKAVELKDAPRGPIRLDSRGNPVQNIYIRKVEHKNGGYHNTVVETFPNVSQFWKYDPAEFLKQPVYGRDFPPCVHCKTGP